MGRAPFGWVSAAPSVAGADPPPLPVRGGGRYSADSPARRRRIIIAAIRSAPAASRPPAPHPEWECVDLKAVADVPKPVTLAAIKAEPRLKDMVLVKNARLSVQPVSDSEWALVCRMGDVDTAKLK